MQPKVSDPSEKVVSSRSRIIASIRKEIVSLSFWATISSLVAGAAVVVGAWFFLVDFIEQKVSSRVDDLMRPHQHLFSAISAMRNEDQWGTVSELRNALDACNRESETDPDERRKLYEICLGENSMSTVIDSYLWAVVTIDHGNFVEMQDDFAEIQQISRSAIRSNGWRLEHMGLYFIRAGNAHEALRYLDASVAINRQLGDYRGSAWSHWGRSLALLLEGRDMLAVEEFRAALRCSPREFIPFIERGEEYAISEEPIISAFVRSHPSMKNKIRSTIVAVRGDNESELNPILGYCEDYEPEYFSEEPFSFNLD